MISLSAILTVIIILFTHWVADFVLQSDWQATNKSKNMLALLAHTFTYSVVWYIPVVTAIAIFHLPAALGLFPVITFVFHTITDYFTSRLNTKLWTNKKVHEFFVSIGFDQWLHYVQLLLTYYFLTRI